MTSSTSEQRSIVFTVFGRPVGQGAISRGRHGKGYHANDKILQPWRDAVRQAAERATGRHSYLGPAGKGEDKAPPLCGLCGTVRRRHGLFVGAVQLDAVVAFAPPKSDLGRRFPISAALGDWDHHARSIGDALTGLLYADDSQIVDGHVRQVYVGDPACSLPEPGALITITEVS